MSHHPDHSTAYWARYAPRQGGERLPCDPDHVYIEDSNLRPQPVVEWLTREGEPREDVEDVVQELFIYMWHSGRPLPRDEKYAYKLLRIFARRKLKSGKHLRWKRERATADMQSASMFVPETVDTESTLHTSLEARFYTQWLQRLTADPERWAAVLAGEYELQAMEARLGKSKSSTFKARNDLLWRLQGLSQSMTPTEVRHGFRPPPAARERVAAPIRPTFRAAHQARKQKSSP